MQRMPTTRSAYPSGRRGFLAVKIVCLIIFCICVLTPAVSSQSGSVGIGTSSPNASAAVDIQSTSKGILIPRMTTAQRNAIASPAAGLLVFDNTTGSFWFRSSDNWIELVDTMNNVWKKNGPNAYLGTGGNVGVGTTTPGYDLHISRPAPSIGFFDAGKNQFSGYITGDSADMVINAFRPSGVSGQSGNLMLQVNGTGLLPPIAGNVGIGKSNPSQKLSVNGNLGLYTGDNLVGSFSDNSGNLLVNARLGNLATLTPAQDIIMQFGSGSLATSGKVGIGTIDPSEKLDINGNLRITGEVNRESSGASNMVPIAYGRINADGSIAAGTGNFSVSHSITGQYSISVTGESFSPTTSFGVATVVRNPATNRVYCIKSEPGYSSFRFYIHADKVNYTYASDLFITYVSAIVQEQVDAEFIFALYKL